MGSETHGNGIEQARFDREQLLRLGAGGAAGLAFLTGAGVRSFPLPPGASLTIRHRDQLRHGK